MFISTDNLINYQPVAIRKPGLVITSMTYAVVTTNRFQ